MRKSSVTSRSSFPSGASLVPDDLLRLLLAGLARGPCPCTPCVVPSRCLRKYSWPLPRRAEQVRAPDEQVARPVVRIVRVVAGELQLAGLQRLRRRSPSAPGRRLRPAWRRRAGSPAAAAPTAASPCARRARCSRSARRPTGRPARSATGSPTRRASRSATGRCARRRTRSSSSAAAAGPSRAPKASGSQPVCGRSFSCPT